jgi:hypothetical protein
MVDSSGNVLAGHDQNGALFFTPSEAVNLTNQGADIGTTTLTSVAGFYHVLAVLEDTTTDGGGGSVTLTINWTDDATTAAASITENFAGIGRTAMSQPLYLASGNLTYAITHSGNYGTAKYGLRIRVVPLG